MPTPKAGYYTKDGERVPGTTTVIGRFKDSGGLLQWAFKQGKSGKSHLYEEAEKAADIGTVVHGLVEAEVAGRDPDKEIAEQFAGMAPEDRAKVMSGFDAYRAWARNFAIKITDQEILLVSEKYKFGGTPDAVGIINDQIVLLDYKTSNGVYTDYLIQLAAYQNLWNENFPDRPIAGGAHLLRFAKEYGDFAHHYYPDLSDAWRQFLLFREAYDLDKILKKRAA